MKILMQEERNLHQRWRKGKENETRTERERERMKWNGAGGREDAGKTQQHKTKLRHKERRSDRSRRRKNGRIWTGEREREARQAQEHPGQFLLDIDPLRPGPRLSRSPVCPSGRLFPSAPCARALMEVTTTRTEARADNTRERRQASRRASWNEDGTKRRQRRRRCSCFCPIFKPWGNGTCTSAERRNCGLASPSTSRLSSLLFSSLLFSSLPCHLIQINSTLSTLTQTWGSWRRWWCDLCESIEEKLL